MEITELKIQQKIVFLILISICFYSCSQKDNTLIELIITDYKTIDKSKNISIDIREDTIRDKYYFILQKDDSGFEIPYYTFNFKGYNIKLLNYTNNFDVKLLGAINLDSVNPKPMSYRGVIDDSEIENSYIYEINDSILIKRMSYDIDGNLIEEKIISKKWR